MHSIRIHKVVTLMTSVLYFIGFWHRGNEPTIHENRVKPFHFVYFLLFVLSLTVGAFTNEKREQSIYLAETSIATAVLAVKLWILIWKQHEILDILNRVCVFSIRYDEDYNVIKNKLRGFVKFVLVFLTMSFLSVIFVNLITLSFIGKEKALFVEIAFPLDWRNNEIAFWIAATFVFTGMLLVVVINFFTTIIWYLLMTCSLRYEVMGTELKNMGRINEKAKVTEKQIQQAFYKDLTTSIDAHEHIKKLGSELESFFSGLFLIQFGTSGLCICSSVYCLAFDLGDNTLERCIHFIVCFYFIYELFMITYFGTEMKRLSDRLSYSLFESNWYNQPQSTKKCIIIFGELLKQPQVLIIYKLYPLTLETYTRILKSAYSLFNIFKNFQQ